MSLQEVRKLFANKDHWIKGHYAKDAEGNYRDPSSPEAVRFCLVGGLDRCGADNHESRKHVQDAIAELFPGRFLIGYDKPFIHLFNDDPEITHDDVLRVLDRAIEVSGDVT